MAFNEKMPAIFQSFFKRILEEQKRLDMETGSGMFEKLAFSENVYRYWLIAPLYSAGYTDIEFEKVYENQGIPRGGRRPACDIVAKGTDTLWIELKFAYSNTGYTTEELLRDVTRLNEIKQDNVGHIYCLVLITETGGLPPQIQDIDRHIHQNEITAENAKFSEKIGTLGKGWPDAHVQAVAYYW